MAKSNRDRVGEIMDALKKGLGPFVLREFNATYGNKQFLQEIELALTTNAYSSDHLPDVDAALEKIDTHGWLNLMWRKWNEVFKAKLGHSERNYVSELMSARNEWAHQQPFTNDDAHRVADTAGRLLDAINAPKGAQVAKEIAQELLRLRFEAEAKKSKKSTGPLLDEAPTTTTPGLKPWRRVVKPHPDVASGRYIQAEFAADLAQVVQGKADPEYGDPKEFFRRTYLTEGLRDLLVTGIHRLTGQGGDPVVQLQTSFGGGKTHSMLAMYHLFSGLIGFTEIPGAEDIVSRIGKVDDRITATRAVIVGTAFSATEPREYKDCTTHTLWGDIAYQLGGLLAYKLVETADLSGVSPGSDTILQLLEEYGPALVIIDELVAFARNLYGAVNRLPAGTFDAVMTFMQSLTEAIKRSSDSMLLVSLPESNDEIGREAARETHETLRRLTNPEIGGEHGQRTLEILGKTIGRIEAIWKPVTATESFEIVRRRLFSTEIDFPARDAVLNAFRDLYRNDSGEFPQGVAEGEYFRRMQEAYPIHPELFARLYEDWSTLERFQRTRGVLRLMATVIHRLWTDHDQSLMIMPASIPLFAATVRNEMLRYLPENWPAIVDADIDGENSKPFQLDKDISILGQYSASRRVARAVFIGSAPSVAGQSVRGVEEVRIRLATVQPGEQVAVFNDALRRMSNQLTYLYTDGSRYWYDTRPTVNRMAQDRAQAISEDAIYQEQVNRLRSIKFNRDDFSAAHIAPQSSGDVVDEARARVVVLGPGYVHKRSNDMSEAQEAAKDILENRGNSPRLHRNMLVFIAPDMGNASAWEQALREYLAWQSIEDDTEQLNLDAQQRRQVKSALERTDGTVESRLQETYSWLIVPTQTEPTGSIEYPAYRISGTESLFDRAARKLRQSAELIYAWSADNLVIEMDRYLWKEDQPHLGTLQLWEYLSRYCYLPRLFNESVLIDAIAEGVESNKQPFAYAESVSSDGEYLQLKLGQFAAIHLNESSVLVRSEVAVNLVENPDPPIVGPGPTPPIGDPPLPPISPQPSITRYHGSVAINPQRVNKEISQIVEEVIQQLTSQTGTDVTIRLEITAKRSAGFEETTVRNVNENSRTLKFDDFGFE